jgi:hypothetical protein
MTDTPHSDLVGPEMLTSRERHWLNSIQFMRKSTRKLRFCLNHGVLGNYAPEVQNRLVLTHESCGLANPESIEFEAVCVGTLFAHDPAYRVASQFCKSRDLIGIRFMTGPNCRCRQNRMIVDNRTRTRNKVVSCVRARLCGFRRVPHPAMNLGWTWTV